MVSYDDRSRRQKECCQDPNARGFCCHTRISTRIWQMIGSLQRIWLATIHERQRKHVKKRVCKSKSHGCCQAVWHHYLLPRSCLCLWRSGVWRAIPSCTLLSCNSFLGSDSLSLLPAVRISLYFHHVSSCSQLTLLFLPDPLNTTDILMIYVDRHLTGHVTHIMDTLKHANLTLPHWPSWYSYLSYDRTSISSSPFHLRRQ